MALSCAAVVGTVRPQQSAAAMVLGSVGTPPSCGALLDGDPLEANPGCPHARPMVAPNAASGRLALTGQKVWVAGSPRSEAGVSWALGRHVALQLTYTRTAGAPMMREDHDDGVLTRLRLGF